MVTRKDYRALAGIAALQMKTIWEKKNMRKVDVNDLQIEILNCMTTFLSDEYDNFNEEKFRDAVYSNLEDMYKNHMFEW